jgi:RNA polymerase sigma factor (sigma-70 family)
MTEFVRLSDVELIARCLDQDADAWEKLLRRYQRLIASITFKFGLSSADASDVFQSVSMTLFQQLPSLKKQEKLSSWIITVTVRECWKLKKRQAQTDSIDTRKATFGQTGGRVSARTVPTFNRASFLHG